MERTKYYRSFAQVAEKEPKTPLIACLRLKKMSGSTPYNPCARRKNLPTVAVSKGACTAIGFKGNIDCPSSNTWLKEFFGLMDNGYTVNDACAYLATQWTYSGDAGLYAYVLCGNGNTTL